MAEEEKKKQAFSSNAVSSNQQHGADAAERFQRPQPTGGGRQLGLSHPVRTETVNAAMPPALLSGTVGGRRGGGVRGLTSLYPPVSLNVQKSLPLPSGLVQCVSGSQNSITTPFQPRLYSSHCTHMLWVQASVTPFLQNDFPR